MVSGQLLFPMTINMEGRILMRGARETFLLSDMRVFTLLVLFSPRIGNLSTQLSTVNILLNEVRIITSEILS